MFARLTAIFNASTSNDDYCYVFFYLMLEKVLEVFLTVKEFPSQSCLSTVHRLTKTHKALKEDACLERHHEKQQDVAL